MVHVVRSKSVLVRVGHCYRCHLTFMERIFILVGLLLSLNDDLQLTLGNFPAESDKQRMRIGTAKP